MRLIAFASVVACAGAIAAGAAGHPTTIRRCPPTSVGPGSLHRGGTIGAACLVASFRNGCRAATYTLSSFGVDTIRSETFVVSHRRTRCVVDVTDSFRVVPRPAHVAARYVCRRLRALAADRCTPTRTIPLTKLSN